MTVARDHLPLQHWEAHSLLTYCNPYAILPSLSPIYESNLFSKTFVSEKYYPYYSTTISVEIDSSILYSHQKRFIQQ